MAERPRLLTESELNTIRGKCLVGHQTRDEVLSVFMHYDLVEIAIEEFAPDWRQRVGLPDAEEE